MAPLRGRRGILAASTLLLLFLGLIYAYSVVLAPMKALWGWSVSQMTLVFALSIGMFTLGGVAGARLSGRWGTRATFMAAGVLLAAGFVGCSVADGPMAFPATCLCYCVLCALGIGLAYDVLIAAVTEWFPDRCGLAQGICLMGFGIGGFLLGPAVSWVYGIVEWRVVLRALGVAFLCMLWAAGAVVVEPAGAGAGAAEEGGADGAPLVADRRFRLLYLWLFLVCGAGMAVTGLGRELPASLGADAVTAAFVIGFVNVGSGLGRLVGGGLADRFGAPATIRGTSAAMVASIIALLGSLAAGSLVMQAAALLACGFSWGVAVIMMTYVCAKVWGAAAMARNLATVNTYSIFASLAGSFGAGLLAQATSFSVALGTVCALCVVGVAVGRPLGAAVGRSGRDGSRGAGVHGAVGAGAPVRTGDLAGRLDG